jgi:hypothetical protein
MAALIRPPDCISLYASLIGCLIASFIRCARERP